MLAIDRQVRGHYADLQSMSEPLAGAAMRTALTGVRQSAVIQRDGARRLARMRTALSVMVLFIVTALMSRTPAQAGSPPLALPCIEDGGTALCTDPFMTMPGYQVAIPNEYFIGPFSSEDQIQPALTAYLLHVWGSCKGSYSVPPPPYSWPMPAKPVQPIPLAVGYWNWYVPVKLTATGHGCTQTNPLTVTFQKTVTLSCASGWFNPGLLSASHTLGACEAPNVLPIQPHCCGGEQPTPDVGDPIEPAFGNKIQVESDYTSSANSLAFVRTYSFLSVQSARSTLGPAWSHTYLRSLQIYVNGAIQALRPDGSSRHFSLNGTSYQEYGTAVDRLIALVNGSGTITGYQFIDPNDTTETYDATGTLLSIKERNGQTQTLTYSTSSTPTSIAPAPGLLINVTDSFGYQLNLTYNAQSLLASVTAPDGGTYAYAYTSGLLSSVTHPDKTTRSYAYNESAYTQGTKIPNALTGMYDENATRYATFGWNSQRQAISSVNAGGVGQTSLQPNVSVSFGSSSGSGSTSVTDALGATRTYNYSMIKGIVKFTGISAVCPNCGDTPSAVSYDANGNVASRKDFNANVVNYLYDLTRNLEISRTEAYGTPLARTITTQWNANWRLRAKVAEPLRVTTYGYDGDSGVSCGGAAGSLCSKTIAETTDKNGSQGFNATLTGASRTWTYTYDSYGRMLTAKGPRTDVNSTTTYTYYTCTTGAQCGQLNTVTDPVGNLTTYNTYNAHGQATQITDPNGIVTTLAYDLRLRLTDRCSNGSLPACSGGELTHFDYYPTGLLKKVTLPDSSYVLYTYDDAHRLTEISDGAGNSIQYTLDNMGNRTAEKTYDPSSVLHRTHTRVYNTLNELYQDVNAAGTVAVTTTYGYDNNGNQTTVNAPVSRNTTNVYDALNRLSQITDPNDGNTYFGYDGDDNLTSLKDPRGLMTGYTYNGFGDLKTQVSPDTGTTTNTYDSGGNLSTATDARNSVGTYTYDKANRVTSITYKYNGVADQTISFGYDSGTNGKGHLTSASDANHSLSWTYDPLGRVRGKGLAIGSVNKSVGYSYANGDLTSMVTPSGQSVVYGYNTNHQVTSITVNGTTVLSGVKYEPFGGANGWTWGNGTTVSRSYNGDGLVSQIVTAGVTLGYSFDNADRISGVTDSSNSALSWTYGYDPLDRLNSATTSAITDGWTYDANGNRLTQTGTTAITFHVSSTDNQLTATTGGLVRSYSYDAAGNTTAYGSYAFSYNNRGRMKSTSGSSTNYLYNALGQMIEKSGTLGTTIFMQDEAGHLIGEYSSTGVLVEETIWLGDIPVATLRPNGSSVNIFYVHTDHLNTPRKVSRPSDNKLEWRWDADPFGAAAVNQNPQGLGTFVYNLRFPGQYYQAETGVNYNWNRDYDPLIGRYVEPDPIGQLFYFHLTTTSPVGRSLLPPGTRIGYWNRLYVYSDSDPVALSDSSGLDAIGDWIAKNLGKSFAQKMQDAGLSGILASGCIAENCKRGVTKRSTMDAYGDCASLLDRIIKQQGAPIAGGMQALGGVNGILSTCAEECSRALAKLGDCPDCKRATRP